MTEPRTPPQSSEPDEASPLAGARGPQRFSVWWAVGFAFVAIVGLIAVYSGSESAPEDASGLDQFEFLTPEGEVVTLADFRGQPIVLNYFAAWCPPCRAELPDFEAVHQQVGDEVLFLGISRDSVTDAWLQLIEDSGVTYTTVFEGNVPGSYAFLGSLAMPTTVFISADGTVQQVWSGALDEDSLLDLIDEHLT